ncbi:enoyl-CoA hydratase/isomerase family protein [Oceanobacillus piezotolerans]|uniref:Enoyl-CoA hydratase/isomerase family protein n=1 Tax=Oceanobacillus piezotolerans TaxID=2448030 RepID=A0A498DK33_9BACI|nr:enoyl-CoA hydratase/isomerase family protein [Oceanobacillus piezotolerans]RLL46842.1 enoyl-CoA hydratase/isomerase family protein [Oceanobacillus piezotolerans]
MTEVLKVRKEGQIAYLTMNRPNKLNSLSGDLVSALISALKEAERDDEIKGIILSGEGKAFCSGGDIDSMTSGVSPKQMMDSMKETSALTKTILDLDKFVISAVHGFAAGAGFSLALASDFVIADKNTQFISSFRNIGLTPDLGLIKLLSDNVSSQVAKEWISSGRRITADEVYSKGIANRLSESDNLLADATEFAQFIVEGPPTSNRFVKYLVNHASEFTHESSIMQENIIQSLMFQTEDSKEGIQAFLEKRSPNFTGK